jgi:hypothetical protein
MCGRLGSGGPGAVLSFDGDTLSASKVDELGRGGSFGGLFSSSDSDKKGFFTLSISMNGFIMGLNRLDYPERELGSASL